MSDQIRIIALYKDIETAAKGTDVLAEMGKTASEVQVVTGSPINPEMLGRPHPHTNVPRYALVGAATGLVVGILLAFVTPRLYEIYVGGKPLTPGAPSIVQQVPRYRAGRHASAPGSACGASRADG